MGGSLISKGYRVGYSATLEINDKRVSLTDAQEKEIFHYMRKIYIRQNLPVLGKLSKYERLKRGTEKEKQKQNDKKISELLGKQHQKQK